MNESTIYRIALRAALEVELESLYARIKAAAGFQLNGSMQVECTILGRQIDALEKKLIDLRSNKHV